MPVVLLLVLLAQAPAGHVVIVQPPSGAWPEVEVQVAAELQVMGLTVSTAAGTAQEAGDRTLELLRLSGERAALAAVRLSRSGEGALVELWVGDGTTGKLRSRTLGKDDAGGTPATADAQVVALHVVDMLRAAFLEIGLAPPVPPARPEPPPPAAAARLDLAAGPTLAWAAGGLGPFAALRLDAGLVVAERWRVELSGFGGTWVKRLHVSSSSSAASARVEAAVARLSLGALVPLAPGATLIPSLGLGAIGLRAKGDARPPLESRTVGATVSSVSAGLVLTLSVAERLTLRASAGATHPLADVDFALGDAPAARLGTPILDVGVALALGL